MAVNARSSDKSLPNINNKKVIQNDAKSSAGGSVNRVAGGVAVGGAGNQAMNQTVHQTSQLTQ